MGNCMNNNKGGNDEAAAAENANNRAIDNQMIKQQEKDSKILKLLLLGAGESGKSTLFKALISIYGEGYPEHERAAYVEIVWGNTIESMLTLVENIDLLELKLRSDGAEVSKKFMLQLSKDAPMSNEVAEHIENLWNDKGIQETYDQRSKFQIFDSAGYFFDRIQQIASPTYLPNEDDVLRSRVRTTGIVENAFKIDGNEFKLFDVGGQRNERKKWIHCFENVTAVIFVVAISAFDLVLFEDETTNRMVEALSLFEEICNSKWFKNTSMILFLNKMDIFEDKIKTVSLKNFFPEFSGDTTNVEDTSAYIKNLFIQKNQNQQKKTYACFTTATNTGNISHVFNSVKDIIINKSLADAGLM